MRLAPLSDHEWLLENPIASPATAAIRGRLRTASTYIAVDLGDPQQAQHGATVAGQAGQLVAGFRFYIQIWM